MKKRKKLKRPKPFGMPDYPALDFYIQYGTVQVVPVRPNVAIYGKDIRKLQKWLDRVKKFSDQENKEWEI